MTTTKQTIGPFSDRDVVLVRLAIAAAVGSGLSMAEALKRDEADGVIEDMLAIAQGIASSVVDKDAVTVFVGELLIKNAAELMEMAAAAPTKGKVPA